MLFDSSCKNLQRQGFMGDFICGVTKLKVKDGERKGKCETNRHKECQDYKRGGGGFF